MTVAAGYRELAYDERPGFGRWTLCLAIVLALHIVTALYLASRTIGLEPPAAPPAAVLIELPPAPPPPIPEPPLPPPQVAQPEPPVPPPLPEPVEEPPPPPPPPQAITLPKPPPPRQPPKPRPIVERPPPEPPVVQAPPRPAPPPVTPAPTGPPPAVAAAARASWQSQLAAALARNKRYPRAAQEQRQQGAAALSFVVDRNGRVLSARLARSSGFPLLDEEVLALIQRAQPLPPAPADVVGNQFPMTVPISFTITR